jgi:hypothetical protein
MGVDFSRTSHIIFFAGFLPFLSIVSAWCFSQIVTDTPFWLETLSPLMAYGIFYALFEYYLWSHKMFSFLRITSVPDLRGRWTGSQQSSYKQDGENVISAAVLEIRQSFSRVSVCAYYEKSQSDSVVATFVLTPSGPFLYYTFDNEPNSLKNGTMENHKGTAKIQMVPDKKHIVGAYFNSLGNQGEMSFEFADKQLKNRFNNE